MHESFALENLEGRTLLSVVAPTHPAPTTTHTATLATTQAATATQRPLTGTFNSAGTYTQPPTNPDTGPLYDFRGTGRKSNLGKFKLTARVRTPGFINNGRAKGRLVITTPRGSIILSLNGPPQPPGALPDSFAYTIRKGTGAYAGSTGKGRIAVSASDTTHRFVFRFNQAT